MGACCSKGEDVEPGDYPDGQSSLEQAPVEPVEPVTPEMLDPDIAGTTLEHIADREGVSEGEHHPTLNLHSHPLRFVQ